MGTIIANVAKGKFGYYAGLPAANDAIIAIPLLSAGLESDATLQDYQTVAALLAAANDEQTTMGRKTCASVTNAVDYTTNKLTVDFADITWTAASGSACGKILFAYDPDTTTSTDSTRIPLFMDDFVVTPAGGDVTYAVNASGIADAS